MIFIRAIIIILFFIPVSFYGQVKTSSPDTSTGKISKKQSFRKKLKTLSAQQINQLKEGALLVRLQTKKMAINTLRKNGKTKLADDIEKKQKDYNLKIVTAFKSYFDFCPTFFFYSDYSQNVSDKKFGNVVFLSDILIPDTSIKFNNKYFLTAEFGIIEPDTSKHISGGEHMGFGALLIKSDQFIQLRRPFPYYVRTLELLPTHRTQKEVVKKMNKKLTLFYKKVNEIIP